jgi:dihydrofolate synthase/folylpolyglutamate synthase
MIRSLDDAEAYLEGLINLERRVDFDYEALGLARIRALLAAIGDPQRGLPCVHVAGSKGKGATTLAVHRLLGAAGVRCGAFTSPHLESWRERFLIEAAPVASDALVDGLVSIQPAIERLRRDAQLCPSFFDASTALALALFRRHRLGAAAIEVGLGGRLDSTNIVESKVSVITSIQLEHTDKLGGTLAAIAGEKAGILRPGIPVVCGPLEPSAAAVVQARARELDAPLLEPRAQQVQLDESGIRFSLPDGRSVRASVLGVHQATNLALAIGACEVFLGRPLTAAELGALDALVLPGRIERFGDVILDCAHTPDSVRALCETLERLWPGRSRVLGISVSRDKDVAAVVEALAGPTRVAVATQAEPLRSLPASTLAGKLAAAGIETVESVARPLDALARLRSLARPDELIVLVGSVYLAGAVRGALVRGE